MDLPKARIEKGIDEWVSLTLYIPGLPAPANMHSFLFPPETDMTTVRKTVSELTYAIERALKDSIEAETND